MADRTYTAYPFAMDINDPKIALLRTAVSAAQQEFDLAVTFHELWKPAAFDKTLHERMGVSYATNAFHVVRLALRRETLLALMRLWDTSAKALRLDEVARTLQDSKVVTAVAEDRASRLGFGDVAQAVRRDLQTKADEALRIIDQYSRKGSKHSIIESLRTLRHERLAHRKLATAAPSVDHTDDDIERLYQDMARLVSVLLSLVNGMAYNPQETGTVYARYSKLFWLSVRGERTEGHPKYRQPAAPSEF
jgi:AbiU2